MRALFLAFLLSFAGCAKHDAGAGADPAALLAEARARSLPFALRGSFSVTLRRGDAEVSTRGGMVLHAPDQFRVEINGPVGTPAVIVASDGTAINVWDATKQVYYSGQNAASVLGELTGGAVSLSDVVRVLTATLPLPDASISTSSVDGRDLSLVMTGEQEVSVAATVDGRTSLLRALDVRRAEQTLIHLDYGRGKRVGKMILPWALKLDAPSLDLGLEIEMESWDELGQVPQVFDLRPPKGATEKDLVESLKESAEKARHPQP